MQTNLDLFFSSCGSAEHKEKIIELVSGQLNFMKNVLERCSQGIRFYASSILIVFDALDKELQINNDNFEIEKSNEGEKIMNSQLARVRLIDFGKVKVGQDDSTVDQDTIDGI